MLRLSHAQRMQSTASQTHMTIEQQSKMMTAYLWSSVDAQVTHERFVAWADAQLAHPEKDMSKYFARFRTLTVEDIDTLLM